MVNLTVPIQQGERQEREHELHHLGLKDWVAYHIGLHREKVGLHPNWLLYVFIACPSQMPEAESSVWWYPSHWCSIINMRCDLDRQLMIFLAVEEMYKLALYRTSELFLKLQDQLRRPTALTRDIEQEYRDALDQQTALLAAHHLGWNRPMGSIASQALLVKTALAAQDEKEASERERASEGRRISA